MKIPAINGQPAAIRYGSSYKSNTALAANTPETVFSAAANTLGAYVWSARFAQSQAGAPGAGYLAKTSAPATVIDGDVICGVNGAAPGGSNFYTGALNVPVFVPAGKGLYFISTNLEASAYRSVLYTLLT